MSKSPEMQRLLDDLTKGMFGMKRSQALTDQVCVICHKPATSFKDPLSFKEFGISGMCQECQDKTFGE